jgi:hypothetical protein
MAAERAFVLFSSAHRLTDSKPQEKIAMKGIKKLMFLVVFVVFLFPKASVAENVNLELYANSDDIKFQIGWEFTAFNSYPELGFGIDYGDDYLIGNLRFAIRDEVFTPGLTLGLGLQGYFGEVEIRNRDFDLQALSFVVLGEYDFRQAFTGFPVKVAASISMAPDALSFSDTNRYLELSAGIYVCLLRTGALGVGYRRFEARFDQPPGEVEVTDDALFVGFHLGF